MTYFDKLIRRMAGKCLHHTLNPQLFLWDQFYDPFENMVVVPLSYPNTPKRETIKSSDHVDAPIKSGQFIKKSSLTKQTQSFFAPRLIHGEQQKDSKNNVDTASSDSPTFNKTLKSIKSTSNDTPNVFRFDRESEKKPINILKSNVSSEQRETQPILVKNHVEKVTSQKMKSVESQKIVYLDRKKMGRLSMSTEPLRRRAISQKTLTPGSASLSSQSTIPVIRPSRKRKHRASKEDLPRLMIGRMTVDVVPVKSPASPPARRRELRTNNLKHMSAVNRKQTQKLKFGLGQM